MATLPPPGHKAHWNSYGFANLLLWLIVFLTIRPFLAQTTFAGYVFSGILTLVLLSAACSVNAKSPVFIPSLVLLTLSLLLLWLNVFHMLNWPAALVSGLQVTYLGVIVYAFSRQLFGVRKVTGNVICAALCLYLIFGIFWGAVYSVLESLAPGSFAGKLLTESKSPEEITHHLYYFSFVTLSTLGYGDITPQTEGAAALCQTEAILGQFFALVLVARLVGLQVSQQTTTDS